MNSSRMVGIARWLISFCALAGIVLVYRGWLHVNSTTVALTLLLYILVIAARLGLRYAIAISVVATAFYDFYFLPPVGTFTISDPQNWLALFIFLATGVVGSRLSQQARDEAAHAQRRRHEVELLLALSRDLLLTSNVSELVSSVPEMIRRVSGSPSVTLYLLDRDRLYRAGLDRLSGTELPHLRQLAVGLTKADTSVGDEVRIPLFEGVRSRGLLVLTNIHLSDETFQAIAGLVSIALDRAEALERVAKSEANRESERLRTLILDSITHELRTPLTSIKGAASTLLTNAEVTEDSRRELLTIVDEEADRLNHLVGRAVEMAQIEANEIQMNLAPTSISSLVAKAQDDCGHAVSGHPVTISLPELPLVVADAEMIGKVLCNLLDNAAKYSTSGAPIFISAEQRDGHILTSVADRGIGIDTAEQSLIFDRLYRSRNLSTSTSGTGMGLAISKAIIESHQGEVTVTSQPDHGSVFTFSLPVAHTTQT